MKRTLPMLLVLAGALLSSKAAFSFHDDERGNLAALAQNIEVRSAHLLQQVKHRGDHRFRRENPVTESLWRFQENAREFRQEVEHGRGGPSFQRELSNLLNSWERVERTFQHLNVNRRVYRNFLALQKNVSQLNRFAQRIERRVDYSDHEKRNRRSGERVY